MHKESEISDYEIMGRALDGNASAAERCRILHEMKNDVFREYFLAALCAAEYYELNK